MPKPLSDELLVAYADGELDGESAKVVESALAEDAALRATVESLRSSAALLRPTYGRPLREPVPPRMLAALDRGRRRRGPRLAWLAAAASIAALLLGAGGGYVASEMHFRQIVHQAEASRLIDELAMRRALTEALETSVSGTPVAWHSAASGRSGEVVPVRTFRSAGGAFCREYLERVTLGSGVEEVFGIACRRDNGIWQTVALMAGQ